MNQRRLVAVHCGRDSGFEVIHGLLNRVMEVLRVPLAGAGGCGWVGWGRVRAGLWGSLVGVGSSSDQGPAWLPVASGWAGIAEVDGAVRAAQHGRLSGIARPAPLSG